MSVKLYELVDLREILERQIADGEGELTPELEQALDQWVVAFGEKVEKIALYIGELEAHAEAARAEARRLAELARTRDNRINWLKGYLQQQMERASKTKVAGVLKTVSLQANPERVELLVPIDEADLRSIAMYAPKLVRHDESWALDKKEVLAAHKAGTLPADVATRITVVRSTGIRIR